MKEVVENKLMAQAIVDALPFSLAVLDADGIIQSVNKAWVAFAQSNQADPQTTAGVGLNYLEICTRNSSLPALELADGIRKVISGEINEYQVEYPCHSPEEKRWFILQTAPLQPKGSGAVLSHIPITERVKTEQALQSSQTELRKAHTRALQSEERMSIFLAQMSHEIRTPLNGIIGLIEILLESVRTEEHSVTLTHLDELAEHLLGVVNDILDLSALDAGKLVLKKRSFSPQILVNGVYEMFKPAAEEKGLELFTSTPDSLPALLSGDVRRLRQILINLVSNAIKCTNEGSVHIHTSVKPGTDNRILFSLQVTDTGIGIPTEAQSQLFKHYNQLPDEYGQYINGTGLGLAITKQLTDAMDGSIIFESEVGTGTTFTATIPLHIADKVETSPYSIQSGAFELSHTSPGGAPPAAAEKILVVDDNVINQKILSHTLKKLGWTVLMASNGLEALSVLEEEYPFAVFMDCQMPHMNGFDATIAIRAKESLEGRTRVPIIAITADPSEETNLRCMQSGMDTSLLKPFRQADISKILTKLIETVSDTDECRSDASE